MDCIFCKITSGGLPCRKAYEDDELLAFHDISPQAPVHVILIPKRHVANINGLSAELAARMVQAAVQIAKEQGVENGWRIVSNCGEEAGQTVHHMHFHILGGRQLSTTVG